MSLGDGMNQKPFDVWFDEQLNSIGSTTAKPPGVMGPNGIHTVVTNTKTATPPDWWTQGFNKTDMQWKQVFEATDRQRARDTMRDQLTRSLKQSDPPLGDIRWLIERKITWPSPQPGLLPERMTLLERGYITNQELFDMPDKYEQHHVMHMLTVGRAAGYVTTHDGGLTYYFAPEF